MRGIEFVPSLDLKQDLKYLEELFYFFKVDFVLIPENPLGKPSVSSLVSSKMIQDALGVKCIATLRGSGVSQVAIQSQILGAKYAMLGGIACVSGDFDGCSLRNSALEILQMAKDVAFEYKICTCNTLEEKAKLGATHAITQPLFDDNTILNFHKQQEKFCIKVLPNFMPIFSPNTFEELAKNRAILKFEIPKYAQNAVTLMRKNQELLEIFQRGDFYLTSLNLAKQISYFRELFAV